MARQSPDHVRKRAEAAAETRRRRKPDENELDRDGATSTAEPRAHKVALGIAVAAQVRSTGRPHRPIPQRGFERLIHDLQAVGFVPETELHRVTAGANTKGGRSAPTKRQVEAFQLVADGLTTTEVAEKLGVKQVSVNRLMERLIWNVGVDGSGQMSRTRAMAVLVGAGLVKPPPLPEYEKPRKRATKAKPLPGRRPPQGIRERKVPKRQHVAERHGKVLALVAEGLTDAEIAGQIGATLETIKTDMKSLRAAHGARSRAHLAAITVRAGLVPA